MENNPSVEFFGRQFERQIAAADYQLNPFEQWVLPHLTGQVLDLGCGLGNLSIEAARRGHAVTALDACPQAVADLERRARAAELAIRVEQADLSAWRATATYDTVIAIGLLMFFDCSVARRVLREVRVSVRPGGVAALNVLIEGTTFMAMFDPDHYCLLAADELARAFADWQILLERIDDFAAPNGQLKRFATVIARRPN